MAINKLQGYGALKEYYERKDPTTYRRCARFLARISDELVQNWHLTPEDSKEDIATYIYAAEQAWDDETLARYGYLLKEDDYLIPESSNRENNRTQWLQALKEYYEHKGPEYVKFLKRVPRSLHRALSLDGRARTGKYATDHTWGDMTVDISHGLRHEEKWQPIPESWNGAFKAARAAVNHALGWHGRAAVDNGKETKGGEKTLKSVQDAAKICMPLMATNAIYDESEDGASPMAAIAHLRASAVELSPMTTNRVSGASAVEMLPMTTNRVSGASAVDMSPITTNGVLGSSAVGMSHMATNGVYKESVNGRKPVAAQTANEELVDNFLKALKPMLLHLMQQETATRVKDGSFNKVNGQTQAHAY